MTEAPSFAQVFKDHAEERGDRPAITFEGSTLTFSELDDRANHMAHRFLELGATLDSFVTIASPNSFEFYVACLACWKIGATPQPVSSRLPDAELNAIVELADSAVVVGVDHSTRPTIDHGAEIAQNAATLPDVKASAWKAPTSGGSTGLPKLIVSGDGSEYTESLAGLGATIGAAPGDTMIMPGPLYHNGPFIWSWLTLLAGGHIALLRRFDAEMTLEAIQQHRAPAIYLVPTMMQRMWKLPDDIKFSYDVSSLRVAFHLAEPCPKWLKEAWIDWIGPESLWELYGGTEGQCFTVIRGDQWRERPGSVGQPISGELKICDDDGAVLGPGEIGEVWMRWTGRDTPTYRYIGAETERRDGWECLGDIGSLDEDGFLYLNDRRSDMILVGGANVFPAEVEAAINLYPGVASSAVIGLPNEDKGNQVHAIIEPADTSAPPSLDELVTHLAQHLVNYKLPRTIEFIAEPLRDDAGKVRRSQLRAERLP
ncbi:MAG: AMP-binding protein [Actinomycetia bacterium]|nr:AMP-binding protein [Actinomycetes bacterium]MCP4959062.1 AMP-binding protein [Actinomycetes bacterium]